MTVPTHQELMRPVLAVLAEHDQLPHRDLVEVIARDIGITPEQRQQTMRGRDNLEESLAQGRRVRDRLDSQDAAQS